jgi:cytochrome c-type biogenesis protein CcmH
MILIWPILALMVLAAAALLALPLFDTRKLKNDSQFARAVYRDQLAELTRDAEAGLIGEEQARAAQGEVERRILALDEAPAFRPAREPSHGLMIFLAVILPLLGFAFYLSLGMPGLPGQSAAQREIAGSTSPSPELTALEDATVTKPNDEASWKNLAEGYASADRPADSANAYAKAVALGAGDSATLAAYGQALVLANAGIMNAAAEAAFRRALMVDPSNPMARFFLALAKAQAEDIAGALTDWLALAKDTPVDAPWRQILMDHIAKAADRLGKDPAALAASGGALPELSAADLEAASALSPEARVALVSGMVLRLTKQLEQEPEDVEGWVRLARAYQALERPEDAENAWTKAADLAPGRLDIQLDYADALLAQHSDPARDLPPEFIAIVGRIRTLDPENALGLYYAGLVARQKGDAAEARKVWSLILERLPEGSPQRAELERELDALVPGE